jgi:rhodanese-related sulfurtransferase
MLESRIKMMEPAEALARVRQGNALIVDVREPNEYAAGHIPGAILNPLSRFDPAKVPSEAGKTLIFYCQSGRRCGPAANKLIESGFKGEVHRLKGGFMAWSSAGGSVETGA